jgi:hypothetical protein
MTSHCHGARHKSARRVPARPPRPKRASILLQIIADDSATYAAEEVTAFEGDGADGGHRLGACQRREIDAVLVTELSCWGRSTLDLLHTLQELEAHRVSVIAMSGLAFLSTPHGRMVGSHEAGKNLCLALCRPPTQGAGARLRKSRLSAPVMNSAFMSHRQVWREC